MKYRTTVILPRKAYTADGTETIDIDLTDTISQLLIRYEPDNNPSGSDATGHPVRCITKIELVDGSKVLYSLSGAQAQGIDFYDRRKETPSIILYLTGNYSDFQIPINFGRWLWDTEYAFNPRRFVNPQLKITIDIDAGGDESNDGFLTVLAHVFDEKQVSPGKMLMTKQVKTYTAVASAHEYTDLPLDYPYKQIFLRNQVYGSGLETIITGIKVTEDFDKKIPLDLTMGQILASIMGIWPKYHEWIIVPGLTAPQNFYCTPTYWPTFTALEWRSNQAGGTCSIYAGDGGRFTHDASAAGPNWQIHAQGWAPHAVIPVLPDLGNDPADWYNPAAIKNLKIDVEASSSGSGSVELIAQQALSY